MLGFSTFKFVAISLVSIHGIRAGNTTCLNDSMDWFTQSVGETPCRVYERLRSLCVPGFQVGNMNYTAPGDRCVDQLGACCCNSVAFSLSMLCMSCQYGVGSGLNKNYGIDAPEGTYEQYLNKCSGPKNDSLPDQVQKAVCNTGLKIPSYAYRPSWISTGEWFSYYVRQAAEIQINSGENDTSARCNGLFANNTSNISTPQSGIYIPMGGVVGIAIGGFVLLCLSLVAGSFFGRWLARRGKNKEMVDLMEEDNRPEIAYEPYPYTTSATQPIAPGPILHDIHDDSEWAYSSYSSSDPVDAANTTLRPAPTFITTMPRQQKVGISLNGMHDGAGESSARPLLDQMHSSNELQATPPIPLESELPPSYEPRRS
ncbi:unnamed protein product [Rhizoctonia solani]|uniref:Uncharacterized protein n=1 Tax=Rhizoctonia solani TaxID=456999 RepID=A0A8H3CP15_9AGAM|nr:unnamed protein product [Rhizoctonia solani]